MSVSGGGPHPAFPGAVGISRLAVYPWEGSDGKHGGTPHLHLACSECYVVVSGRGRLETLTMGAHSETALHPGDVVWFEPGTIHRAINDGDLVVVVVMQNGGLPEAGDAVMTFPPEFLADHESYAARADLGDAAGAGREARARSRRDLALEGFERLSTAFDAGDTEPLAAFHRAAAALVRPKLDEWRAVVEEGAAVEAARTIARLDELAGGGTMSLTAARVAHLNRPEQSFGMCGRLDAYDIARRAEED
ncbi:cupin domain-containing protein [Leifsonia sp. ZF2019]|uniref:cupin domain-containing protein n=1 Tax=Leifsonia sp. ZF2019 TaxID=2781978 RepID=UPI001CBB10B1|nr:cupin domain-containing protein [Leifsonia sp. ZF2019]UAJ79219.1 cupin domain-containing protein [Leifsonia sp. ZF2019]